MRENPPSRTMSHTLWFRWTAGIIVLIAAMSALLTAAIDTANVTTRFRETVFEGRPYWLHTFSIAMITVVVGAAALWGAPRLMWAIPARVLYGVTAALNVTVPIVRRRHREYRLAIPGMHVVLAALLVGLIVLATEGIASARGHDNRTLDTSGPASGRRGSL